MLTAAGDSTYLYWLIVGCEALFWLVLALGLTARYLLRRERASRVLLFSLPGIDLLLVALTAADLDAGSPATFAHGLAAAYVGFTVAFGSIAVRWADEQFARWFAARPPPSVVPTGRWGAVRYELMLWFRSIVAWIIALVVLSGLIAYVDRPDVTQLLMQWYRIAFGSVFLWFIFGPVWSLVFFRRPAPKVPGRS